eukprot:CAMPEP_0119337462 /NCGR_PEP_ID=MMETSP1333-20130426/94038_1 /TAXON_ID=418940 /ORGANISM="Scyphosphaera apsteinii, Strain RCC1455" /LENGTH=166 /DNA_ID=CAMNT_0007348511 /DNA_START=141 /DNA_END=641 /DNA_ORIENTATION=-
MAQPVQTSMILLGILACYYLQVRDLVFTFAPATWCECELECGEVSTGNISWCKFEGNDACSIFHKHTKMLGALEQAGTSNDTVFPRLMPYTRSALQMSHAPFCFVGLVASLMHGCAERENEPLAALNMAAWHLAPSIQDRAHSDEPDLAERSTFPMLTVSSGTGRD